MLKSIVYLYHQTIKKTKMNNLKTTNFWNHNYRHYMRGLRTSLQSEIKQSFNDFDLELCGVSDLHEQLICLIVFRSFSREIKTSTQH